eukprot:TRINITY_DN899_c0_g1_i1.p1 TRINITY_DN899_c0_g1~~TRINITY_DN899_c0_g1_i1.p1  ORF type:complete len:1349 (+),score=274.49 TRINITY_DN899_c0_g1_i1:398-4048(+)
MTVVHNCSTTGSAVMMASLNFGLLQKSEFYWLYISGTLREGFSVGTTPHYEDVVYDSRTLPLWDPRRCPRVFFWDQNSVSFYVSLLDGQQEFEKPIVYADNNIINATLSGPASDGGNINATSDAKELIVDFECISNGKIHIIIKIPIPGYEPVYFGFSKVCQMNVININVGTFQYGDDVVSDGQPTLMWAKAVHNAFILPNEQETVFWLSAHDHNETVLIQDIQIETDSKICEPYIDEDAEANSFVVVYDCFSSGDSIMKASLIYPEPYQQIDFYWTKRSGQSVFGLKIGTSPGDDDVVLNGKAVPAYHPFLHTAIVLGSELETPFYMEMNLPKTSAQIKSITISLDSDNLGDCQPLILGNISNGGIVEYNITTKFFAQYNCEKEGKTTIKITVKLSSRTIDFEYNKLSGGTRRYLNIGTLPGYGDIVNNGVTLPLWNIDVPGFRKISGGIKNISFYLQMSVNTSQTYVSPVVSLSEHILEYKITPETNGVITYDEPTVFILEMNCTSVGQTLITITLPIRPFNLEIWAFYKMCGITRQGFNIGTKPNDHNVAYNGAASLLWKSGDGVSFDGNHLGTRFYIQETDGTQHILPMEISSTNSICAPYINNNITTVDMNIQIFDIIYNCHESGQTSIQLDIGLSGSYLPIGMLWNKVVGGKRGGLMVGSQNNGKDIVDNGTVSDDWRYNSSSIHTVGPMNYTIDFHFSINPIEGTLDNNQTIKRIIVTSEPSIFNIERNYLNNSIISDIDPKILKINYNCLAPLTSIVNITVELYAFDSVKISHKKICPGAKKGLFIGTTAEHSDVVKNGVYTEKWGLKTYNHTEDGSTIQISFWIWMEKGSIPIPIEKIYISQIGAECDPRIIYDLKSVTDVPQKFTVDYNCISGSISIFTVGVKMDDEYSDPSFRWIKRIGGIRKGFNIGTSMLKDDVVRNGIVLPPWQWNPEAEKIVGEWVKASEFYIWMSDNSFTQLFGKPKIISSSCKFDILGKAENGGVASTNGTLLLVNYQCNKISSSIFQVDVDISPFQPVSFYWQKISNGKQLGINIVVDEEPYYGSEIVVINGRTQDQWNPKVGPLATVTTQDIRTNFTLSITDSKFKKYESVNISKIEIETDPKLCAKNEFIAGFSLKNDDSFTYAIEYTNNCNNVTSNITTTIYFDGYKTTTYNYLRIVNDEPYKLPTWAIVLIVIGILLVILGIILLCNFCVLKRDPEYSSLLMQY